MPHAPRQEAGNSMATISSSASDQMEKRIYVANLQDASSASNLRNNFAVALITVMGILVLACHNLHYKEKYPLDLNDNVNHHRLHSNHNHYPQFKEHKEEPVQLPTNEEVQQHRLLWSLSNFFDPKSVAMREPSGTSDVHHANSKMAEKFNPSLVKEYNHENIMITPRAFRRELFLLYYDPVEDAFLIYVDENKDKYESPVWSATWSRLSTVMPTLIFALRNHFADRFQGTAGGSSEFITFVSTGDLPQLLCDCVLEEERLQRPNFCQNHIFAPILQFGSVYKDTAILPSVVPMPQWNNVPCFMEWQMKESVCLDIQLNSAIAGQLGGEEGFNADASAGELKEMPFSVWDSLVPTLIWRGSDHPFLACIHPGLRPIDWANDIAPQMASFGNHARGVIDSLFGLWDNLTPRWRAVALTAKEMSGVKEKETEKDGAHVRQRSQIEWIDAKFTIKPNIHGTVDPAKMIQYQPFMEYGIQLTDEHMSLSQQSKYKYHIDLGGGGGTTWFGTIEKLGMPGVLFHHRTSAKDYIHDDLVPWVHYIPVNEDLSNLREMYDWAEANNDGARKISEAGTEYVKHRAERRVMKAKYGRYYIHSLKNVVDAYLPIEGNDATQQMMGWLSKWSLVGKCTGRDDEICELKNWRVKKSR